MTRTQNKIKWTVENLMTPETMIINVAKIRSDNGQKNDKLFSAIENKSIPALCEYCRPYLTTDALSAIFDGNISFANLSVRSIAVIA